MSVWWLWEQLDARSALIFVVVLLFVSDYLKHRDGKNFPPGPFWVPFVGDLFKMASDHPHLYMAKLTEKFGNVYSLRFGGSKIVIVNGYKMAKEALLTQGYALTGRPQPAAYDRIYKIPGLTLSNGYTWKEHKRFTLTTLRNFGVGKKSLESIIMEEAKFFVEAFEEERGQPFNPHYTINNAISNIICLIVLGHRFEYSDSHYREIQHLINRGIVLEGSWWTWVYNAYPRIMRYLPGRHNELFSVYGKVLVFLREEIRNHKEDLDPTSPRDYIDTYLLEIEKRKDDPAAAFNDDALCSNTLDLFVAGSETTATTLRWALLFMVLNPQIQEKVQAEIDSVLGQTHLPSMEDKINMPYTEAVVHEIQRMGDIVPLNLFKMTVEDMTIGGYAIPKDTAVLINLNSILKDKSEWETPNTFNPAHFLTPDGKFRRREAFMPFSAGKRSCLGEPLARIELFLFFTCLLQKFTFCAPEGTNLTLDSISGFTRAPVPYKICAIPRHQIA
ncbi:cytochrome P450 2J2-like [Erpetoichthys calabaricus]|uniref:Cytochrome P450 n=1 Tax=Erpetoichthys calabaricus TaxID=27687 RepID=A0A8C4TL62_ERPCA|nr:cytochrome P450 2J2-like [Erpetoichthys calabaricus]